MNELTPERILMFLEDFCKEENLKIESAPPQVFMYEFFETEDQNSILAFHPKMLGPDPEFWPLEIQTEMDDYPESMGFFVLLIVQLEDDSEDQMYVAHFDKDSGEVSAFIADTDFRNLSMGAEIYPPLDYDYGVPLEDH